MKNQRFKELANEAGLDTQHDGIVLTKPVNAADALEKYGESIIRRCVEFIEGELNVAYDQQERWTIATLESLVIYILNDFDLEIEDLNSNEND